MKVNLIRKASIEDFISNNARSKSSMDNFQQILKDVDWTVPADIKTTFGRRADIVCEGTRVVFDVGGGVYRVICGLAFGKKTVFLFVKFVGTHAEYQKLCNPKKNETGICDVDLYKSTQNE